MFRALVVLECADTLVEPSPRSTHVPTLTGTTPVSVANDQATTAPEDIVFGKLHLFRRELDTCPSSSPMVRTQAFCIPAFPAAMSVESLLLRAKKDDSPTISLIDSKRVVDQDLHLHSLFLRFETIDQAELFASSMNGRRFCTKTAELCHVLPLSSVRMLPHGEGHSSPWQGGEVWGDEEPVPESAASPEQEEDRLAQAPQAGSADAEGDETQSTQGIVEEATWIRAPLAYSQLPTCPRCLERMDSSVSGIVLTSNNQDGWSTVRCRVCVAMASRPNTPSPAEADEKEEVAGKDGEEGEGGQTGSKAEKGETKQEEEEEEQSQQVCALCDLNETTKEGLWVCLVCAHVGCGRYHKSHAVKHFNSSGHRFAVDLTNSSIWDYQHDGYIHRVADPSREHEQYNTHGDEELEMELSMMKLQSVSLYYDSLLQSQLEQQHTYFQDKLKSNEDRVREEMAALSLRLGTLNTSTASLSSRVDQLEARTRSLRDKAKHAESRAKELQTENDFLMDLNRSLLNDQSQLDGEGGQGGVQKPRTKRKGKGKDKHKATKTTQQTHTKTPSGAEGGTAKKVEKRTLTQAEQKQQRLQRRWERAKAEKEKRVAALQKEVSELMLRMETAG